MTSREFSEVDHDLLADYVGGALDGTPEQVRVARLVEEDPAWGRAYAELVPAVELVRDDLADWAATAPEMPLAVADRIAAALAGAGPAATPTAAEVTHDVGEVPGRVGRGAAGIVPAQATGGHRRTGGTSRATGSPGRGSGPGRRPRRWARTAGPIALAAASLAAAGLGLGYLVGTQSGGDTAVTADSARDEKAEGSGAPGALAAAPFRTTGPPRHSGTDYTPERLSAARLSALPPAAASTGDTTKAAPDQGRAVAPDLGRLTGQDALNACLGAISAEHAGGPVTVDLVDYASFQGQPALVVAISDAGGARWAWVSGPECGVPGSGADTRFRTRVG